MKKKAKTQKEPLSDKPQDIDEHNWYYEEPESLILVHEVVDLKTNQWIRTDQIRIPWAKMFRSVRRRYGCT